MEGEGEVGEVSPVWPKAVKGVSYVRGPVLRPARSTEAEDLIRSNKCIVDGEGHPKCCSTGG